MLFPIVIQSFEKIRKGGYVYEMEFKLNRRADKAMRQITDKQKV